MKYLKDWLSLGEAAAMLADKLDLQTDDARTLLATMLAQDGHVISRGRLGSEYNHDIPSTEYRKAKLDWAQSRCGRFSEVEVHSVRLDLWIAAKLQQWDTGTKTNTKSEPDQEKSRHPGGRPLDLKKEHSFWTEVNARIYHGIFNPEPFEDRRWLAFRKEMAQWMLDQGFDVSTDDWIKPRLQALRTALETPRN